MDFCCHCTGNKVFWLLKSQINFNVNNLLKDNAISHFSIHKSVLIGVKYLYLLTGEVYVSHIVVKFFLFF
jgi:hypothetical protein